VAPDVQDPLSTGSLQIAVSSRQRLLLDQFGDDGVARLISARFEEGKRSESYVISLRTQIRCAGVVSGGHRLLLMYADGLAFGDGAESVRVTVASAVHEFTASTWAWLVVVLAEGASARTGVHGKIAHVCKEESRIRFPYRWIGDLIRRRNAREIARIISERDPSHQSFFDARTI